MRVRVRAETKEKKTNKILNAHAIVAIVHKYTIL